MAPSALTFYEAIKDHQKIAFLPNLGGTLPNDAFSHVLGMPTIWIPHSYGGCSQHAPNEHLLASIAREGLQLMTGLFWDLGESRGVLSDGSQICLHPDS